MLHFDDTQNKILGCSNHFYCLVSSVNTLKSNDKLINNITKSRGDNVVRMCAVEEIYPVIGCDLVYVF